MTQLTFEDYKKKPLSGKLKALYLLLCESPLTSIEIREKINTCCPGTDIADLRKKGTDIKCEYVGMSYNKKRIFRYTMTGGCSHE